MKTHLSHLYVEFADCDTAGIVFYPHFYTWFDRGTERLFKSVGLTYQAMREQFGIAGLPLLESSARYWRPCRHGDAVQMKSWVEAWEEKIFIVKHDLYCQGEVAVEGREVRAWAAYSEEAGRMRAIAIPAEVRDRFEGEI